MAASKKEALVEVVIPRTKKDQEDAVVWINNTRYQIQPGKRVKVPESVAAALEDRDYMVDYCMDFEEGLAPKSFA